MANLYADENFDLPVVEELRLFGHDVLTVQETGQQGSPDPKILAYATTLGRAVLTLNRRHFVRLHAQNPSHRGIIVCSNDDPALLANRIDQALAATPVLDNQLLRINRPP